MNSDQIVCQDWVDSSKGLICFAIGRKLSPHYKKQISYFNGDSIAYKTNQLFQWRLNCIQNKSVIANRDSIPLQHNGAGMELEWRSQFYTKNCNVGQDRQDQHYVSFDKYSESRHIFTHYLPTTTMSATLSRNMKDNLIDDALLIIMLQLLQKLHKVPEIQN